jgi:hypothetical protein
MIVGGRKRTGPTAVISQPRSGSDTLDAQELFALEADAVVASGEAVRRGAVRGGEGRAGSQATAYVYTLYRRRLTGWRLASTAIGKPASRSSVMRRVNEPELMSRSRSASRGEAEPLACRYPPGTPSLPSAEGARRPCCG